MMTDANTPDTTAADAIRRWLNALAETGQPDLEAVLHDPDAPPAKTAAALCILRPAG